MKLVVRLRAFARNDERPAVAAFIEALADLDLSEEVVLVTALRSAHPIRHGCLPGSGTLADTIALEPFVAIDSFEQLSSSPTQEVS
jgi:hypothetical protein